MSRQYRRHFHNEREILYILVMSNLNFETFSKNRIFRSILVISRQYRRHFHNQREIPHMLVPSNLNFDKFSKNQFWGGVFPAQSVILMVFITFLEALGILKRIKRICRIQRICRKRCQAPQNRPWVPRAGGQDDGS